MTVILKRDEIRKMLLRKNLSQNAFAKRAKISKGYFSQLLAGDRHPSPRVRRALLSAFRGVTFDDLFEIVEHHSDGTE